MKRKRDPEEQAVSQTEDFASCSSTDCTGLIPAAVNSQAEEEAYQELYPYLTPPAPQEEEKPEKNKAQR